MLPALEDNLWITAIKQLPAQSASPVHKIQNDGFPTFVTGIVQLVVAIGEVHS